MSARFNDGRFQVTTEAKLRPLARFGCSMVWRVLSAFRANPVESTVKSWEVVGYFGLSPCGRGMVQKRPFSGNTWALSAHPDRSRVGAGLRESLAAVLGLQFRENR